jgi:hypothetical protein
MPRAGSTPNPDAELADAARRAAGSARALAALFSVSESTVSHWGRSRQIPRHLRPRLEAYVTGGDPDAIDVPEEPDLPESAVLLTHFRGQLGDILPRLTDQSRAKVMRHLLDQVSLLAELAHTKLAARRVSSRPSTGLSTRLSTHRRRAV